MAKSTGGALPRGSESASILTVRAASTPSLGVANCMSWIPMDFSTMPLTRSITGQSLGAPHLLRSTSQDRVDDPDLDTISGVCV